MACGRRPYRPPAVHKNNHFRVHFSFSSPRPHPQSRCLVPAPPPPGSLSSFSIHSFTGISQFLPAFQCLRLTLAFRISEPTFFFQLCRRHGCDEYDEEPSGRAFSSSDFARLSLKPAPRPVIAATSPRKRWRYVKTTTFASAFPFLLHARELILNTTFNYHQEFSDAIYHLHSQVV